MEPGDRLGPYEVIDIVGAGGMGEVYCALDRRLGRRVAVKVLPGSWAADPERLRRFEQEARAIGALSHPNVLAVHDVGSHDGVPYLVTELLEGETLRSRLRAGPLTVRKAMEVGAQVARGLAAAHEKGLVHRDLKPENLFLTSGGLVKILDFGLAKLSRDASGDDTGSELATAPAATTPGTVMGTVGYMAPEQVRGQAIDLRADIFALGAILYEMLTGRRAFQGDSAADTITAILREDPPELTSVCRHLPVGLERVVRRCLEKEPEDRYHSSRDLAFDLEAMAVSSGPTLSQMLPRVARPRAWLVAAGATAVLAASGLVGLVIGRGTPDGRGAAYRQLTFRRGIVTAARFAPDGATVYYSAVWDGLAPEVFATRPESRESQALGLRNARLAAAAAGELAIMLLTGPGPMGTVALAPLGAAAPRPVAEQVFDADWDPSSGDLAIVHEVDGKARLEYPIGRDLFTGEGWMQDPRLSRDRRRVAFVHHPVSGDTRGAVVVVEPGRNRLLRAMEWKDIGGLAWSPDGHEVWFTASSAGADRAIRAVGLGGAERLIAEVPGRLVLHDVAIDGRTLVTRSLARREARGVLPGSPRERDFTWLDGTYIADLSADGSKLLFGESAEGGGPGYSVFLRATDGSLPVRLGEGLALGLSPDGEWVLTLRQGDGRSLVVLPTGAGQPIVLERGTVAHYQWACWFPDGRRVLILASEEGQAPRVFVQNVAGGPPRPLGPPGVAVFRSNTIAPDGSALVAVCPRDLGSGLCLIPFDGRPAQPLPALPRGSQPLRWSADGRYLFVRGPRAELPVNVRRLEPTTGRVEAWLEVGPADLAGVTNVSDVLLSADGRHYVFHFQRTLSDLYLVEGLR